MRRYAIDISARAIRDLMEIRTYIREDNPLAAERIAEQLLRACDGLEFMPQRGASGEEPGSRKLHKVWPYAILYAIDDEHGVVHIAEIRHGALHL